VGSMARRLLCGFIWGVFGSLQSCNTTHSQERTCGLTAAQRHREHHTTRHKHNGDLLRWLAAYTAPVRRCCQSSGLRLRDTYIAACEHTAALSITPCSMANVSYGILNPTSIVLLCGDDKPI